MLHSSSRWRPVRVAISIGLVALLAACQTATQKPGSRQIAAQASLSTPVQSAPLVADVQPAPVEPVAYAPPAVQVRGHSEFVMDMASGAELSSENADQPRYPASLTKMMTLYLLFEELEAGRMNLSSPLKVSAHAASKPPARLGLKAGSTITVDDAVHALAVKSANDVAVTIAENISGTETAFARKMTAKARALGLTRTHYVNASGLYDPGQVTTARDMAKLGRALKLRFPQYARFFKLQSFTYNGRTYPSTNNLLGKVAGVDGLKTGYISQSGYNLVATANRGGRQRLVVVMGGKTEGARDKEVTQLLESSF
ncbi:D-alanyl-D-alanine carboxypeptidase family protein [Roseibium litorale]|uniref:D-alanyl-D-alanine carboxypeptidase n=1 Tax=Roseibium litorale TaxID=2803841 RepID=A0ABR9CI72_9HYPH|nr:D-alanyl-D-alanine carboxypeptidase family protein [Roseibium litorale]MBD8890521.1 D-alanyl-D-alanine carboxypeptidase [Roseibium litorale]